MNKDRLRIITEHEVPTCAAEILASCQFGDYETGRSEVNRLASLAEEAGELVEWIERVEAQQCLKS